MVKAKHSLFAVLLIFTLVIAGGAGWTGTDLVGTAGAAAVPMDDKWCGVC